MSARTESKLPEPDCPLGYPRSQLEQILGDRFEAFQEWMRGQTVGLCLGRRYVREEKRVEPDECAGRPHFTVVYSHDVARFIAGKEPLD